ncbi:MAG: hypothetical protein ACKO5F_14210 [Synechococcus sp.]
MCRRPLGPPPPSRRSAAAGRGACWALCCWRWRPPRGGRPGCGGLLDQRHSLAARAMAEEIRLAGSVRKRLCPELNRRADAAGSAPQEPPFDYGAYLECRHQAEAELARTHRVLNRNRLGFPFYTEAGAAWARASDQLLEERTRQGCPGAL